jgi:prepilin-type N-terminal cleavage/methylation domain-containing protein
MKRPRSGGHAPAMTLVEVLVALAITSMLTAAAFVVLRNMTKARQHMEEAGRALLIRAPLRGVVAADLAGATGYKATPRGFILKSMSCLQEQTLERRNLPVEVEYTIVDLARHPVLVRIQRPLTGGEPFREAICLAQGVRLDTAAPQEPTEGEWQPLRGEVKVSVDLVPTQPEAEVVAVHLGEGA